MKKCLVLIAVCLFTKVISAQPNCNVFKWNGDSLQYKACELSKKFNNYYQFEMEGLAILDSCIVICPYFAYAHYETAVVYLKSGNFIGWDKHINEAVKYEPLTYLGLRASCRAKTFGDYQGAINDIDSLDGLVDYDIGFVHDGAYHLDSYKALCYKALGNFEKSIEVFEKHIKLNSENIGLFDYLHLGVAYQKIGKHELAIECFKEQEKRNNLAENNYYAALSCKALKKQEKFNYYVEQSKILLQKNQKLTDAFSVMEDEVFESDLRFLKE